MVLYKKDRMPVTEKAVGLFEYNGDNGKQAQGLSGQDPEAAADG